MSHQRYPSIDPIKEPHSVSLKVLRLSRPSLVSQQPLLTSPSTSSDQTSRTGGLGTVPASLSYTSSPATETNPDPFLLTPILNLPPSFGSAYVGETFSCTLCANHDVLDTTTGGHIPPPGSDAAQRAASQSKKRVIRDVRIEAEMKTPGSSGTVQQLVLTPPNPSSSSTIETTTPSAGGGGSGGGVGGSEKDGSNNREGGVDLQPSQTLQKIVSFDLKEEGNHVLAVTVSYYEATETSGRTRTFRKLYQFICKGALIVRTKVGVFPQVSAAPSRGDSAVGGYEKEGRPGDEKEELARQREINPRRRRWVMEAQLENCSEDAMQLSRVTLELEKGVHYRDCNWEASGSPRPVLQPGEIQQCCFIVGEDEVGSAPVEGDQSNTRIVFGVLGIGWRSEMGNKGYLTTGKLGTRIIAVR